MTAVRHMPAGARTVVLFTSDHGEAFRDHGQLGHTGSVYEEEIHVPAWVDAPPGTLTDGERTAIAAAGQELAWHVDVAPTILDLLGIEKSPELSHFRGTMSGRSLLARASAAPDPVPLTNCSELWGCAFRNWGMMRGSLKLEARAWDFEWHCWDVLRDPREERDLGAAACGALAPRATELFGGLPRNDEAAQRWTER
jgi:arylsulfatase A-like enzyme